jgi:hypothetical protein
MYEEDHPRLNESNTDLGISYVMSIRGYASICASVDEMHDLHQHLTILLHTIARSSENLEGSPPNSQIARNARFNSSNSSSRL